MKRPSVLGVNERLFAFGLECNDSFTVMPVRRDELPNILPTIKLRSYRKLWKLRGI
jgi:hypothetical protein